MENINIESRRKFLKNVAYKAPVVIALGGLVLPETAGASTFTNTFRHKDYCGGTVDVEAVVYGNSGTGQLDNPAGAKIKYWNGEEYKRRTYTIEQVEENSKGMFDFAQKWFSSIS